MPEVRGTVVRPNGLPTRDVKVEYRLVRVGSTGLVHRAVGDDGRTYTGVQPVELDADGTYQVELPPNAELDPPDTRWARTILAPNGRELASDPLIVPVGDGPDGAWPDNDLLVGPLDPIPEAPPSGRLMLARSGPEQTLTVASLFQIYPIGGTVVQIDDPLPFPVELRARATMRHDDEDFANVVLVIAPVGESSATARIGHGYGNCGAQGIAGTVTVTAQAELDPGVTGAWQLYATSFNAGDVTVTAGAKLGVYRV